MLLLHVSAITYGHIRGYMLHTSDIHLKQNIVYVNGKTHIYKRVYFFLQFILY
jgi:hypothetical protein